MTMQVGLQTATRAAGGDLSSSQIKDPPRVKSALKHSEREGYPASPLLATRPQRYSVQLNDQLTALQQADSYLSRLEKTLLDHRHATSGGERQERAGAALQALLANRPSLSAGRVDRQLLPVLQGEAQVTFHAPALEELLSDTTGPVSLMFSADAGRGRRLAAVSLSTPADALNPALQITNALQRIGIMPRYSEGKWTFATDEAGWAELQHSFSVADAQGEHTRRLILQADPAPSEALRAALAAGPRETLHSLAQSVLNQVGEQRQRLAAAHEKGRQRMDVMVRMPDSQSAEKASAALGQSLAWACHHYDTLAQAVNGQATLSALTVVNLLG